MKANISALMSAEPCSQRDHVRSEAVWYAVTAAGHGSQSATGPAVASAPLARGEAAKRVENEDKEKREAELRRAQDQLKKSLEDVDYTGAAAVKEKIAALMSAAPSVEKEEEEKQHQAELQRAQDQLKKCLEDVDYTGAAAVKERKLPNS